MAEEQPKVSVKEKASQAADKGAKWLWIAISWGVPILLIILAAWYLTRPSGPVGSDTEAGPSEVYDAYTDFVRRYRPPASQVPSPGTVDDWLNFFDSSSRDWFRDNTDTLSFLGMRRNAAEWGEANRPRRRQEAMQYLLMQGPLGGGAVSAQRFLDDSKGAILDVTLNQGTTSIPMGTSRSGWVFSDMMGMRSALDQQLAGVQLPASD